MAEMDVRKLSENIDTIRFADKNSGGSYKTSSIGFAGLSQVDIITSHGVVAHVKFSDIDNFIIALKKAKELWSK